MITGFLCNLAREITRAVVETWFSELRRLRTVHVEEATDEDLHRAAQFADAVGMLRDQEGPSGSRPEDPAQSDSPC